MRRLFSGARGFVATALTLLAVSGMAGCGNDNNSPSFPPNTATNSGASSNQVVLTEAQQLQAGAQQISMMRGLGAGLDGLQQLPTTLQQFREHKPLKAATTGSLPFTITPSSVDGGFDYTFTDNATGTLKGDMWLGNFQGNVNTGPGGTLDMWIGYSDNGQTQDPHGLYGVTGHAVISVNTSGQATQIAFNDAAHPLKDPNATGLFANLSVTGTIDIAADGTLSGTLSTAGTDLPVTAVLGLLGANGATLAATFSSFNQIGTLLLYSAFYVTAEERASDAAADASNPATTPVPANNGPVGNTPPSLGTTNVNITETSSPEGVLEANDSGTVRSLDDIDSDNLSDLGTTSHPLPAGATLAVFPSDSSSQSGIQFGYALFAFDANNTRISYDGTVTWSSSDTSVATIDQNALLSAIAAGVTTITGTLSSNGSTASASTSLTVLGSSTGPTGPTGSTGPTGNTGTAGTGAEYTVTLNGSSTSLLHEFSTDPSSGVLGASSDHQDNISTQPATSMVVVRTASDTAFVYAAVDDPTAPEIFGTTLNTDGSFGSPTFTNITTLSGISYFMAANPAGTLLAVAGGSEVQLYTINQTDGTLTAAGSAVDAGQAIDCITLVDASGADSVIVGTTGTSNNVQSFTASTSGLTAVTTGGISMPASSGVYALGGVTSPNTGLFWIASDGTSNNFQAVSIDNQGNISPVGSPLTIGFTGLPTSITVANGPSQSGESAYYIYVSDANTSNNGGDIFGASSDINGGTALLSSGSSLATATGGGISSVATDSLAPANAKILTATTLGTSNNLLSFTINSADGTLTAVTTNTTVPGGPVIAGQPFRF